MLYYYYFGHMPDLSSFWGREGGKEKEYINSKSLAEETGPFLLVNFTSYKKWTESLTFPIYRLALCGRPQSPKDQVLLVGTHSTLRRSHCVKSRPWTTLTSGLSILCPSTEEGNRGGSAPIILCGRQCAAA